MGKLRILLVAILVVLLAPTAFAATNGTDNGTAVYAAKTFANVVTDPAFASIPDYSTVLPDAVITDYASTGLGLTDIAINTKLGAGEWVAEWGTFTYGASWKQSRNQKVMLNATWNVLEDVTALGFVKVTAVTGAGIGSTLAADDLLSEGNGTFILSAPGKKNGSTSGSFKLAWAPITTRAGLDSHMDTFPISVEGSTSTNYTLTLTVTIEDV